MVKRRRQWTALKDLRPERPMVLFETSLLENYVDARELVCTDPDLRAAEHRLRLGVRHAEEIGDDLVLEPRFLLYWDIEQSDYGVPIDLTHATDAQGGSLGYHFNHPLRTPEDVRKLKPRTRRVDRAKTLARRDLLEGLFGDILPVRDPRHRRPARLAHLRPVPARSATTTSSPGRSTRPKRCAPSSRTCATTVWRTIAGWSARACSG